MTNIIEQYYRGITHQIRAEVNFINTLFHHQGVKGEGNEEILRDLLRKFIPKKYGIGTGVVIDRYGNQSRQSDIIIYDSTSYPSLLALTNVHLFPVDIVYATVEVKTTLNATSVNQAKENIASIKRDLSIIENEFMIPESRGGDVSFVHYTPHHPLGIVFAYNSEALQFETFKSWFTPHNVQEVTNYPVLIGCLDQGLIQFTDIYPQGDSEPEGKLISLVKKSVDGKIEPIFLPQLMECYPYEGMMYPVKKFGSDYVVIDQSRAFLLFMLVFNELLSRRRINPGISFINQYLTEEMRFYCVI